MDHDFKMTPAFPDLGDLLDKFKTRVHVKGFREVSVEGHISVFGLVVSISLIFLSKDKMLEKTDLCFTNPF